MKKTNKIYVLGDKTMAKNTQPLEMYVIASVAIARNKYAVILANENKQISFVKWGHNLDKTAYQTKLNAVSAEVFVESFTNLIKSAKTKLTNETWTKTTFEAWQAKTLAAFKPELPKQEAKLSVASRLMAKQTTKSFDQDKFLAACVHFQVEPEDFAGEEIDVITEYDKAIG